MVGVEEMADALSGVLMESGNNAEHLTAAVHKALGSHGIDPEAAVIMGNNIVHMAVAAGQEPEETIVSTFQTALLLGAMLGVKP